MYETLFKAIDACKEEILAAKRYLWNDLEAGFRKWKAHAFMKEKFESYGYTVHEAEE